MQAVQLTVWKSPPPMRDVHHLDPGPTPIQIQEKAGVSQSTAFRCMPVLQRAELVESTIGHWTECRRIATLPELPGTRR
jgi:hypothetical protein